VVSSVMRNLKIESDMKPTLLERCVKRGRFDSVSVESEVLMKVCLKG